jgi:TetR/AcrR family transcriptional regulator, transcriptional repressor for nem operon
MDKDSTKQRILKHGARIVYQKGFNNTGIQEILTAAGVPKGSFYFYFKSKEDFGLALIDYYAQNLPALSASSLTSPETPPLQRLRAFFEARRLFCNQEEGRSGCPIGNLTQEMGILNEEFQAKLREAFRRIKGAISECLEQAREQGETHLPPDSEETADFILNSWEGALLRMKAEGNTEPLLLFEKMVFERLLKR